MPIRNGMFVRTPRIGNARSAATRRAIASVARFGGRDDLGEHRIVVDRDLAALDDAGVDAHAGHPRLAVEQQAAGLRQKALRRILGVDARLDRVAALGDRALASTAAARRTATSSCARTRSMPATASVTACSTCRRVFISRK